MEGTIVNYRGSHKTQHPNQMVVKVDSIETKEKAKDLLKKTVTWTTPTKKEIKGVIMKEHGNKGAVRAKFIPGLPGQSIGTKVQIK